MDTTDAGYLDVELTDRVLGAFFRVYNRLGHGFLESVYERALEHECRKIGLAIERQVPLQVFYDDVELGHFRVDLVVERRLLIELKASSAIDPSHVAQLVNYLRASGLSLGLLLNFGTKPEVRRFRGPSAHRRIRESRSSYSTGAPSSAVSDFSVVLPAPG